jgi:hypothetical protein
MIQVVPFSLTMSRVVDVTLASPGGPSSAREGLGAAWGVGNRLMTFTAPLKYDQSI